MKFIDMFCGMGTIRLGMEQAGHECVYSVEWDKWKRKIYSIIFGGEPDAGDIKGLRGEQLPAADIWCFGAPCQDFSIAGARAGLDGDRSNLVREVFRLVRETEEEYRPKYLIYENVKGMLSSNKGFDYLEILIEMEQLGYDTIEYSLLDSKDFGVPHHRERVFTIGHFRNRSTQKIFPIKRANRNTIKELLKVYPERHSSLMNSILDTDGISPTLDCMQGGNRHPKIIDTRQHIDSREGKGARIYTEFCPALTSTDYKEPKKVEYQGRIRKLTPKECWRLQGVPDIITDRVIQVGISDTQMYRAAGDACTVNVIYEIAKRL